MPWYFWLFLKSHLPLTRTDPASVWYKSKKDNFEYRENSDYFSFFFLLSFSLEWRLRGLPSSFIILWPLYFSGVLQGPCQLTNEFLGWKRVKKLLDIAAAAQCTAWQPIYLDVRSIPTEINIHPINGRIRKNWTNARLKYSCRGRLVIKYASKPVKDTKIYRIGSWKEIRVVF